MSKLAGVGKGEIVDIDGVKIEFKSLELDEESAKMMEMKKDIPIIDSLNIMKTMIKKTIKDAVPDVTDKELRDCTRMKYLLDLIDPFYRVNGLEDLKNKNKNQSEKLKEFIKAKQDAANKSNIQPNKK